MTRTIPMIDFARFDVRAPWNPGNRDVIEAIHEGLCGAGFLYIRNHRIPAPLTNALFSLARRFFALPQQRKLALSMDRAGLAWRGYFPVGSELTSGRPDWKEGLYLGQEHPPDHPDVIRSVPMHGANQWPTAPELAGMPHVARAYMAALTALGHTLMSAVALALGLSYDYFRTRFTDEPTVLFRIFNYPDGCATDEQPWGVQKHTDMGFLTILAQDECGGLEIETLSGEWISAPPIPDTFVINIGDMLEYWTHGLYRATPHRVRNTSARDRLSMPLFFDPNWHATLAPIPRELIAHPIADTPDQRARWDGLDLHALDHSMTYGAFVWRKIREVFPALAGA